MNEKSSSALSVAVFCGSRPGADPKHLAAAKSLGWGLAERDMRLVYGGGRVGLMGAVAASVRENGGDVIGIIPEFLMKLEVGDTGNTLEVTDSMHTRKQRMFELSDAFVSLAGGLGTLDETVEIITWKQLRLHNKPIILLGEDGFWQGFSDLSRHFVDAGFASESSMALFEVVDNVNDVFRILEGVKPTDRAENADRL